MAAPKTKRTHVKGVTVAEWCRQISKLPRKSYGGTPERAAKMRAAQLVKNGGKLFGTGKNSRQVLEPSPVVMMKPDPFWDKGEFGEAMDDFV